MAYVVLARKYRPQTFMALVGQEHIVRTLKNAMAMGRVHHAFVFTGARGVGKTTTARLLARALNCASGPTLEPCGTCPSCTETAEGRAPDVVEIDGASHTGVDNIRELREAARYLPTRGHFKLFIVDEVHMLSTAAFNALLKTLEEPPPHVKFIFATTEPHKIPQTILSRCQRFDFRRVGPKALMAHLTDIVAQENLVLGADAIAVIAREAEGSVRDALSLLDQVLSYAGDAPADAQVIEALGAIDRQVVFGVVDALLLGDATTVLRLIAEVEDRGHDVCEVAALTMRHLRDVAVAKSLSDPAQALSDRAPSEIEQLQKQAEQRSHVDWQRLFVQSSVLVEDVKRSEVPKISLEMGLLRMMQTAQVADLEQLMRAVKTLLRTSEDGVSGHAKASMPVDLLPHDPELSLEVPHTKSLGTSSESMPDLSQNQSKSDPLAPAPKEVVLQPAPMPAHEDSRGASARDWPSLVEHVRLKRPALANLLEHAEVQSFGADEVVIAYGRQSFFWDAVTDRDNQVVIGQQLQALWGKRVALRVVEAQGGVEASQTLAAKRERARDKAWQDIEQRAREHVHVQAAQKILGGEITHIKPAQQ